MNIKSAIEGYAMKTIFSVQGPYEVPCHKGKAARTITDENIKEFWRKHNVLSNRRGCYVFGVRAARGWKPGYVGKATKGFKHEIFTPHKLNRYQRFLADCLKGKPMLFFLVGPSKEGAPNVSHINKLEDFLIQVGVRANPELLNVKGTKKEEWGIAGVLRGGKGKPNSAAKQFRKLMKI